MTDPIVIDPPGFDTRAGWDECREYLDLVLEGMVALAEVDGLQTLAAQL